MKLTGLERDRIDPKDWGALNTKVDTLYQAYIVDVVRRPGAPGAGGNPHGKSENPNKEMEKLPEELIKDIEKMVKEHPNSRLEDIIYKLIDYWIDTRPTALERMKSSGGPFINEVAKEIRRIQTETPNL